MKLILCITLGGSVYFNLYAQELKKSKQWQNYIVPVLNSNIFLSDKKIYVFQDDFTVMSEWHPEFIDSVLAINGMSKENWKVIYNMWKLNIVRTNYEWFQGITKKKKSILLNRYNKMKIKKFEIIGVSPIFILSPTCYMVEITRYCPGHCLSTTLFLMEYNIESKLYTLKYSKNVNVS